MAKTKSPYEWVCLPRGLHLVSHHMPTARSVSVGVWVRAGGRYEPPAQAGISHFLEHLVFKGTARFSCEELKQQIEGIGGSLNGFTAEEFTCYMAKVPARFARRAVTALAEMVCRPTLTPADTERERDVILEEIRMYEDSPGQYVHDLFNELLWPRHPLGTLLSGTIDSVRRIRLGELRDYWRSMYHPRAVLVTATGAFDPPALQRVVRQAFRTGPAPRRPFGFTGAPRPRRAGRVRVWRRPTEQAHLCLGTYATPRTHPDRFALELLHVILGANMSSRLFREVRERRGLVYEIGSHIKRFQDTGAFVISAGCDPDKLNATLATIMRELRRTRTAAVSRAELRRAKDYYAGQLSMGLEDTMDHMMWMGEQAITVGRIAAPEGLLKHIGRVTPADLQRVARHLFVTTKLRLAVVGPVGEPEAARLAALCRLS